MRYYRPTKLTAREEEVLSLRSDGLSGKEVADLLGVSVNTIWPTTFHAARKMGVRTTRGAIRRFRIERFRRIHNGVTKAITTDLA